jgi:hypothetical protein
MVAIVALGSASIICFPYHSPCRVLTQSWNMHLILKPSARPPMTTWHDTHLCCEWGSYGTHTTFLCPSLSSWCHYFLVASMGCLGSTPPWLFPLFYGLGALSLLLIHRSKVSLLLFKFLFNLGSISVCCTK